MRERFSSHPEILKRRPYQEVSLPIKSRFGFLEGGRQEIHGVGMHESVRESMLNSRRAAGTLSSDYNTNSN